MTGRPSRVVRARCIVSRSACRSAMVRSRMPMLRHLRAIHVAVRSAATFTTQAQLHTMTKAWSGLSRLQAPRIGRSPLSQFAAFAGGAASILSDDRRLAGHGCHAVLGPGQKGAEGLLSRVVAELRLLLGRTAHLSGSIQIISATVCILQRRNYGVKLVAHTISNLRRVCGAAR